VIAEDVVQKVVVQYVQGFEPYAEEEVVVENVPSYEEEKDVVVGA
jgi:hypothetical protein